eukprot:m.268219 g.268219  ORF g.268219 m.268219 type:complete len:888 (-) comp19734_c0_seq28:5274-7937(-)
MAALMSHNLTQDMSEFDLDDNGNVDDNSVEQSPISAGNTLSRGFFCPICFCETITADELTAHYESNHKTINRMGEEGRPRSASAKSSTKQIGTQQSGVRRMVSGKHASSTAASTAAASTSVPHGPTIGIHRDLSREFIEHRSTHRNKPIDVDRVGTLNKVIMLERLLFNGPSTQGMSPSRARTVRRQFEQHLGHWVPPYQHETCPICNKIRFRPNVLAMLGVGEGVHHCRICGGVMCELCSKHLTASAAAEMVHAFKRISSARASAPLQHAGAGSGPELPVPNLGRATIRCCVTCCDEIDHEAVIIAENDAFLHRRRTCMRMPPPIFSIHDEINTLTQQLVVLLEPFATLASCLNQGEQLSRYEDALEQREQIKHYLSELRLEDKMLGDAIKEARTEPFRQSHALIEQLARRMRTRVAIMLVKVPDSFLTLPTAAQVDTWRKKHRKSIARNLGVKQQDVLFVWECQRRYPFKGFTHRMLMHDPFPFVAADKIRRGRGWKTLQEIKPLPGQKFVDKLYWKPVFSSEGDENGWQYAARFRGRFGSYKKSFNQYKHFVRRRKWWRLQEPDDSVDENFLPVRRQSSVGSVSTDDDDDAGMCGDLQKHWVAGRDVDKCMCCHDAAFGVLTRRHHCRFCGRVVCKSCSSQRMYHHAYQQEVRCCNDCVEPARHLSAIEQATADDEGTPTLVEVFECQRFVPNLIGGKQWSTKHLLAGRRWQVRNPRSRHDGCFEFRQQFEATLPPGTKWVSEEWHVDGTIGEDGWEYAFDLPVNSPLKLHWVKKARMKDFVRRRRWVRNALVPSHHDYEYDYTADIEEDSAAPENTDDAIAGDVAYLDGDLIADDAYYDDEDDDSDVDAFFFGDSSSSEASSDEDFSPAMPHTPVGDTTDVVH